MTEGKLRLDKWLWQARFFKTRSLAARMVTEGRVRVDGVRATKPAQAVAPGATLTFAQGDRVRVIRIEALGTRRGPAAEAQALYADLTPPDSQNESPRAPGYEGKGRPTKRDRRRLDLDRAAHLEGVRPLGYLDTD